MLIRLVELREEVAMFLKEKSDLAKSLRDDEFLLSLRIWQTFFSKLNELNLYLQGTKGADIILILQFKTNFEVSSENLFCGITTLKNAFFSVLTHLKPL